MKNQTLFSCLNEGGNHMTTERNNENRRGKEDNKRNRKWPYILVILLLLLLRSCGNQHPWPVPAAVQFRISTITISIHAPLTGSDSCKIMYYAIVVYFNPRSPHGERPVSQWTAIFPALFQSTLPSRGATADQGKPGRHQHNFNPRSPRGERPRQSSSTAR